MSRGSVLLHFHAKLQMWLPPGGHIEPNELPDDAAVREVLEETGVAVRLTGEHALPLPYPTQLILPQGVQLEQIGPGHQHIDLVYFAEPVEPLAPVAAHLADRDRVGWYDEEALAALGLNQEIQLWCRKALDYFSRRRTPA